MSTDTVIGVDLGGTKILAGVVDREGRIGETKEIPTPTDSQDAVLDGINAAIAAVATDGVTAVGLGAPLNFDRRTGLGVRATNLPLQDVDFATGIRSRFGVPVGVENDGNAAALAEWRLGAGRGTSNLIMLTLGTGVGGGVVAGGRLFRAYTELGHMVIVEDGEPCAGACSGRGHVEAYCSGRAADNLAKKLIGPSATAHDLVQDRHPVLERIGHHLGVAMGSLVNIFGAERIVVGGGFGVAAFDQLLPAARLAVLTEALAPAGQELEIECARLGASAGLIGAGLVAFEADA